MNASDAAYTLKGMDSHSPEGNSPTWQWTAEQWLWYAVLMDAVAQCRMLKGLRPEARGRPWQHKIRNVRQRARDNKRREEAWQESWDWLHDDNGREFGFRWTCDMLGVDAAYIRERLDLTFEQAKRTVAQ